MKKIVEEGFNFFAEYVYSFNSRTLSLFANVPFRIRQYKSRMSKWKLDKNVKSKEMKCIVKKQLQRQLDAPERPGLSFSVRHTEVDNAKVQRWMQRNGVPESTPYLPDSVACEYEKFENERGTRI
jgi:hypothetical protein